MGRPRTRDPGEPRQYVGGTIPVRLKRLLEAAAAANGRSLTAEWQHRLEASFRDDDVLAQLDRIEALLARKAGNG